MHNDTFEMSTGQAHEFAMACGRNGLTRTDIKLLSTGNNLRRSLDFLNGLAPTELKLGDSFPITIDYTQSLAEMIKSGKYDWSNSDITEKRFPVKGESQVELSGELVHLNRYLSSEEVIKEIERRAMRPAKIEELLGFGAKYPEEQRKYPIIALGSVAEVGGFRYVPFLGRHNSERYLRLTWWGSVWSDFYRFLAVRN